MAFGVTKQELADWKASVEKGKVAFITHFWYDKRFPEVKTVTKVGCADLDALVLWGNKYGLKRDWIDQRPAYPHFDLMGDKQAEILKSENKLYQLERLLEKSKRNRAT